MKTKILVICSEKPNTFLWINELREKNCDVWCCSVNNVGYSFAEHMPDIIVVDFSINQQDIIFLFELELIRNCFSFALLPEDDNNWQRGVANNLFIFSWKESNGVDCLLHQIESVNRI